MDLGSQIMSKSHHFICRFLLTTSNLQERSDSKDQTIQTRRKLVYVKIDCIMSEFATREAALKKEIEEMERSSHECLSVARETASTLNYQDQKLQQGK